jgi:hypothetical protein
MYEELKGKKVSIIMGMASGFTDRRKGKVIAIKEGWIKIRKKSIEYIRMFFCLRANKRLFIILSLCSSIYSQSGGAIFLLIPPSPTMNGLGGIGVCLPSDDPYAGYFNPANGNGNNK